METRPAIPDRKLLARLVLIREEARSMMGGGILDVRNGRGFSTLPESEVCFALDSLALKFLSTLNKYLHVIGVMPDVESERTKFTCDCWCKV